MNTAEEFERYDKLKLIEDEKALLSAEFVFISPKNIASILGKYLPGATPFDKKQGPQYCSMYVGAIAQVSNSEGSYSDNIIKLHLGKNSRQQISRYRRLHKKKLDSVPRYRRTYILALSDLKKIDKKLQNDYAEKIKQ